MSVPPQPLAQTSVHVQAARCMLELALGWEKLPPTEAEREGDGRLT